MIALLALFDPTDKLTAVFYLAAVICFGLAAFAAAVAKRFPGGAPGLVAVGLGLWLFPLMWQTVDAAF